MPRKRARQLRWTPQEFDAMAAAALKAHPDGGVSRAQMLSAGMLALPEHRRKTIPAHLGGKSYSSFKNALDRADPGAARLEQRHEQQRASATRARKALAAKRANGTHKRTPRGKNFVPPPDTIGGRVDARLAQMNKTRVDLSQSIGISVQSIRSAFRNGTRFKPANLARMAEFLGVTAAWLKGDEGANAADSDAAGGALLVPHAGTVFKPNGRSAGSVAKLEAVMHGHADSTMAALWGIAPLDVKLLHISKLVELFATKHK